jgi:trehalose 6-phosphate phosphatase
MGVLTPSGLIATLSRLQLSLHGAVAILSGRRIDDVDRLLAPLRLAAAGVHGGELRFAPKSEIEITDYSVPAPLAKAVERLACSVPGIEVEHKGLAIAVHYRAVPAMQAMLEAKLQELTDTHPNRLVLSHGRKVIELTPRTATKGAALGRLMDHDRFRGRRPAMIGDDAPDETALEAAKGLGGLALKVEGEHFTSDEANFRSPEHVRQWLRDLADRLNK